MRIFKKALILLLVLVIAAGIFWIYNNSDLMTSRHEERVEALETAVLRIATQCYALEGAYPTTVEYLVEHYGLVIDTEKYFVDYQWSGDNIAPTVKVFHN